MTLYHLSLESGPIHKKTVVRVLEMSGPRSVVKWRKGCARDS
jgi:hypothetical protein